MSPVSPSSQRLHTYDHDGSRTSIADSRCLHHLLAPMQKFALRAIFVFFWPRLLCPTLSLTQYPLLLCSLSFRCSKSFPPPPGRRSSASTFPNSLSLSLHRLMTTRNLPQQHQERCRNEAMGGFRQPHSECTMTHSTHTQHARAHTHTHTLRHAYWMSRLWSWHTFLYSSPWSLSSR